jgi:hypothetical protein
LRAFPSQALLSFLIWETIPHIGVGVGIISREAATGPRKKMIMMILFRRSPSLALHLPERETVRHMGFGVKKRSSSQIIIRLLRSGNVQPFSKVLQLEGLLKMFALGYCQDNKNKQRRSLASAYTTMHY